jgi:hypothetical protein
LNGVDHLKNVKGISWNIFRALSLSKEVDNTSKFESVLCEERRENQWSMTNQAGFSQLTIEIYK